MITLDGKTVQACNASFKALLHSYTLYNPHPGEVSVNTLMKICSDDIGHSIEFYIANDTNDLTSVKGVYFAKKDGTYAICLISGLNNCWTRMVIAKELFHVIFDNPEYVTTDIESHVEISTSDAPSFSELFSPTAAQLEFLTEYAAMEFLFPYEQRAQLIQAGTQIDYDAIAHQYRVPRDYVERYLSKEYMELCGVLVVL